MKTKEEIMQLIKEYGDCSGEETFFEYLELFEKVKLTCLEQ